MFKKKNEEEDSDNSISLYEIIFEICQNLDELTKDNLVWFLKYFLKISITHEHPEMTRWIKNELNGYPIEKKFPKFRNIDVFKYKDREHLEGSLLIEYFLSDSIKRIIKWSEVKKISYIDTKNQFLQILEIDFEKIIDANKLVLYEYCVFLASEGDMSDYYQFILRNSLFPENEIEDIHKNLKKLKYKKIFRFENLPNQFYNKLILEMNLAYKNRMFTTLRILERKLLENLIIEILRANYKKQIEYYFNTKRGRFKDFGELVQTIKDNVHEFKPFLSKISKEYISDEILPFRLKGNASAHSIEVVENKSDIDKDLKKYQNLIEDLLVLYNNLKT